MEIVNEQEKRGTWAEEVLRTEYTKRLVRTSGE